MFSVSAISSAFVFTSAEEDPMTFAETFQMVMLFVLLGVVVALVIAGAIIAKVRRPALATYAKIATPAALLYAVISLATIRSVVFHENSMEEAADAIDVFQLVITWVTVAICVALIVAGILVYVLKRGAFAKYFKFAALGAFIYALAVAITMLAWSLADNVDNYEETDMLASHVLVPIIIICGVILIATVVLALLRKFQSPAFKPAAIICGLLLLAAIIVAAVMIGRYYNANVSDDGYYNSDETGASVNNVALYISMGVLIVALVLIGIFCDTSGRRGLDTKTIATAAICIALSFALSYIKLFDMPFGGAITLASLLPILVFSYIYGMRRGLMVGVIYGMLQAIQDPYIIHPAQFLLDYPIAFAFVCCGGAFANVKALAKYPQVKFVLGAAIAGIGRYISHVLSGVFAFEAYALDSGMAALPYSLAYNAFVFGDIVIAIIAGVILFSSKTFVKTVLNTYAAQPAARKTGSQQSADGDVTAQTDGLADTDPSAKDDKSA